MSKLLHFLEVNLFEQKPLLAIFQAHPRYKRHEEDKQLQLFDFQFFFFLLEIRKIL